jgi:hypothetical protein
MKIYWKGKEIIPYESFYWAQTAAFFHGTTKDGLSRVVTARNGHLAVCELIYEEDENILEK